ncbi:MAG: PTS sugar transporter subunit IIA, partial [Methylobacteriaceae bacterium]|nr:PTS sugar transporter subunit IIA [Methylobacteriaceae bacterium]
MSLNDLISPQAVIASLKANGKKQALIELSERAAEVSGLDSREILDALIQRERLGSTGIGGGVA